jgi:hypothetical protein
MVTYFKIEKKQKNETFKYKITNFQIYMFGIYTLYNIREPT